MGRKKNYRGAHARWTLSRMKSRSRPADCCCSALDSPGESDADRRFMEKCARITRAEFRENTSSRASRNRYSRFFTSFLKWNSRMIVRDALCALQAIKFGHFEVRSVRVLIDCSNQSWREGKITAHNAMVLVMRGFMVSS